MSADGVAAEPDAEPEAEPDAEPDGALEAPPEGELLDELLLLEGGVEAGGVLAEDELLEGGVAEVDGDFLPSSRPQAASANAAATAINNTFFIRLLCAGLDGAGILEKLM